MALGLFQMKIFSKLLFQQIAIFTENKAIQDYTRIFLWKTENKMTLKIG